MIKCQIKRQSGFIICVVLVFVVTGMYLRIQFRADSDLWGDEIFQIKPMKISFSETINHSRHNIQFPGDYTLIYPFYQLFGENKWGLATPHIIITVIGFYLFYRLCQSYLKTIWGYVITFSLFTFNITLIRHAFEIRPYSVLVTLGIALFILMKYIFERGVPSLGKKVFVSLSIFAAIVFHMFGVYILFFNYLYHLLFSREERPIGHLLREHLKYYSFGIILTLPVLYWYLSPCHFRYDSSPSQSGLVPADPFQFIPKGTIPILKGVFGNLVGRRIFYILLPGIVFNLFVPHKERFKQTMFFIILIILPIALLLLICVLLRYWFIQRLFIWTMPFFALFLGWCWESIIVYFNNWAKGKLLYGRDC